MIEDVLLVVVCMIPYCGLRHHQGVYRFHPQDESTLLCVRNQQTREESLEQYHRREQSDNVLSDSFYLGVPDRQDEDCQK